MHNLFTRKTFTAAGVPSQKDFNHSVATGFSVLPKDDLTAQVTVVLTFYLSIIGLSLLILEQPALD